MTRARADLVLAAVLAAGFAWAAAQALAFPDAAKLFPLAVALPSLALALLQVVAQLRRDRADTETEEAAGMGDEGAEALAPRERVRRGALFLAWIAAMLAGVWLVGFVWTTALVALAYSRVVGRESWRAAIGVTAVSWGLVFGVFDRLLHVPLPAGELFRALGLG